MWQDADAALSAPWVLGALLRNWCRKRSTTDAAAPKGASQQGGGSAGRSGPSGGVLEVKFASEWAKLVSEALDDRRDGSERGQPPQGQAAERSK